MSRTENFGLTLLVRMLCETVGCASDLFKGFGSMYAYKFLLFLSLKVFRLLSSSLLLFPHRFGRYAPRPSSDVCRTREPTQNFELRPLLNPQGPPVLVPSTHNRVQVLSIPVLLLACSQD